jgi:hypothetical protein
MRALMILLLTLVLLPTWPSAQAPAENTLDVYFIDVEGGHAVLYVSPSGQLNVPEQFIANLGEVDTGHWLKLSARADGSFTVTNGRDGYTKTYAAGN